MDNEEIIEYVRQTRDSKRPELALVVEVFDRIFARDTDISAVERGPAKWTWLDKSNILNGFEKWYVLTSSELDGAEGYPLVTIRQSIAPRIDSWLSFSQLVIGPEEADIESSLLMAVANHIGGFDGVRENIAMMMVGMGGPAAVVPPELVPDGGDDSGSGGMN